MNDKHNTDRLRESTLMSLIYIVDKLDEVQLQDRLIRCITNLQNDPEASIRTNAIIFLGKIAIKLKEAVRLRVLCTALVKAMKDNFVHCRYDIYFVQSLLFLMHLVLI